MQEEIRFFVLILAVLALLAGTGFSVLGILGFIRMPDVYTRLHATGKISAFGAVFLTIAAMLVTPLPVGKGLVLIGFLLLGAPAVSHAIASAAYRNRIPMKACIRDDLAHRLK